MEITLVNCKSKLLVKGIDITSNDWQTALTTQLQGYLSSFYGWGYNYETDTLKIDLSGLVSIPVNIVDFGDGSEVALG